ncbi:hypothetical protein APS67_005989 [Streptomyces sp. AVP053U2]|nr:hypothetical protein APS67_005989 [Streptomyces sp. AVP053U2]
MNAHHHARIAVASALLAGLALGPLAGVAAAHPPGTASAAAVPSVGVAPDPAGPDVGALEKALTGLPTGTSRPLSSGSAARGVGRGPPGCGICGPGPRLWGKTGSRSGYHTVLAATRDLSRTVVYSVNAESTREDGFPLVARFALPAFNR